ncbi:hypothetical protein DFH09DRAFT_1113245 [Mycena vulgaris]|nr:hypothetical protein DFH09DRAFT_1113245 [Mycena vulgaris]
MACRGFLSIQALGGSMRKKKLPAIQKWGQATARQCPTTFSAGGGGGSRSDGADDNKRMAPTARAGQTLRAQRPGAAGGELAMLAMPVVMATMVTLMASLPCRSAGAGSKWQHLAGNLNHESAWDTNFLGAVGSPDPQDGFTDGKAGLPAVSRGDFCHVTAGNWTKLTAVALSRAIPYYGQNFTKLPYRSPYPYRARVPLSVPYTRSGRVIGLGTSSKEGGGSGLKERERQRIREAERTKHGGAADATRGHLIADVVRLVRCACEPAQRGHAPTHALRPAQCIRPLWVAPADCAPATTVLLRRPRRHCHARFCGIFLRDGNLAPSVRAETVLYAQEELSCLESALQHVRWLNASRSAVHAACHALRIAEGSARFVVAAVGEGVGVNDDEATFPGVHSMCDVCRAEWLWRHTWRQARRRSTGTPSTGARATQIERGLLIGTGAARYCCAHSEQTPRSPTRWAELTRQALAARQFTAGSGRDDRGEWQGRPRVDRVRDDAACEEHESAAREREKFADVDLSREQGRTRADVYANSAVNAVNAAVHGSAGYTNTSADESTTKRDSELENEPSEDEDKMAVVLESSVKEMALGDWARGKILDDTLENPVKAICPVPWVVSPPPSPPGHAASTAALSTPLPADEPLATCTGPPAPPPPRYTLTEAVHGVHMRGAESVVSLLEEDDGLTAHERYWWQVEEEGPGAAEREMALVEMLMQYRYNGGGDVGDFSDIDDFEKEGVGRGKYVLGPAPAAWVAGAGRQRSDDELGYEGVWTTLVQMPHAGAHRPSARAPRTGKPGFRTFRLVQRGSEELDGEGLDAETASAGSAPRRARVDAVNSPPPSSTPGTLSGEEPSAVAEEVKIRHRVRNNIVAAAGFPLI